MEIVKDSEIWKDLDTIINDDNHIESSEDIINRLKECKDVLKPEEIVKINFPEIETESEDAKQFLKRWQDFIQDTFAHYQISMMDKIVALSKSSENKDSSELSNDYQETMFNVLLDEFYRCIQFGYSEAKQWAKEKYKKEFGEIEELYMELRVKNQELENRIADLNEENNKLKNRKFLGIFKL